MRVKIPNSRLNTNVLMKLQILKIAYASLQLVAKFSPEPKTRVILKNCLLYETSNNIISHNVDERFDLAHHDM